jgi:hypothetical protein
LSGRRGRLGRRLRTEPPRTRLDRLREKGEREKGETEPELPPVPGEGAYLLQHLFDAGPVGTGTAGAVALSFGELDAWSRLAGVPLLPWEAQALRRLSGEYAAGLRGGADPDAPAPWASIEITTEQRAAVDRRLREIFGAMIQAQKGRPS